MSNHYGHPKSKKYERDEFSRTRITNSNDKKRHSKADCRTPPLPTRRTSIEELMKKRESLKHELLKFKHSEGHISNKLVHKTKSDKSRKQPKDHTGESSNRKRHISEKEVPSTEKKKLLTKDYSTEHTGDCAENDSEDEETIIERSRQRRKQLLEKLNSSSEKLSTDDTKGTTYRNVETKTDKCVNMNTAETKMSITHTSDMFSETDDFASKNQPDKVQQDETEDKHSQLSDNWDDNDGYYNVRIGDEIDAKRYTIKSILGQGVFSNVVRAQDMEKGNSEVAIKIIRNNQLTYKTGLKEIEIIKEIMDADPDNKHHCVRLIRHFMHRNHLCMVLESLHMDLRHVVKKYGHHHGLNMKAIMSYSRQLLIALRLLKKIGIVHADIKPDNILVNEKKNILKLCDFGSACKADFTEITPYLVSRFYRAPEIILGIPYQYSVDVWSAACTIYEIATGKIMFLGSSNNKMLKCFMDLKGKFPAKLIKKGRFKDQHFNYNNNFLLHKKDEHTGREKSVEILNIPISRDILRELKKHSKSLTEIEEKKMMQLKDILEKMLTLDQNYRMTVTDCLKHPFVRDELTKPSKPM